MIDLHCHLDLYPNPRDFADQCIARRVDVLCVTTTPSAWRGTSALATGSPFIRTALGLHPQLAYQRKSELSLFDRFLPETEFVGEIGLDGAPEHRASWKDQMSVFVTILKACTSAGGRILSIHSRRAATPVLDLLEEHRGAGVPVLHWFSGSQKELDRAVALGCWFSVGPSMLSSDRGRSLAARMPVERTLTESDGPFALVEGRQAVPWDVGLALNGLADLRAESAASVEDQIARNLQHLTSNARTDQRTTTAPLPT